MSYLSPLSVGSFGRAVKGRYSSRLAFVFLLSCFFLATFATSAFAQEATIVGTVTDPTGATVGGATITITNTDTGIVRTIPTGGDGQYVAPDLHIGRYTVSASAAGFKLAEQKNLVLNVGDRTRIDFKLEVGSAQEHVTVEANAVAVQTDSGEVSNVITGQQVTELATNGRSLYSLFALTPGASSIQGSRLGFTPVSGDSNVSINGQRAGHNLQLLDGGENLDRGGSSGSVMPSVDSIAEFRNITSNYSAEYGLSSAATITSVIKSGTKQFHASAWEFFRNDALNARNYFNAAPAKVAELRYDVYGFNLGGQVPLWKSHPTFFFYNMEWRKQIVGGLLNQNVPLASSYPDPNGGGALIPLTYGTHNGTPIANSIVVPDPGTNPTPAPNCPGGVYPDGIVAGSPFPDNIIPDCMIDPNAKALLAVSGAKYGGIFPKPTDGIAFKGGNNAPTNVREEIARVDHQFSDKFSIFGHWVSEQIAQTYGTSMWSGDNVPSIGNTFGNPSYSAVVHATYVVNPTLLNEVAFNYNGNRINIIPAGLVSAPGFQFNRLFTGPNDDSRIPTINLAGITGTQYTSNWMPWVNKADDYQIRDDISWTKGAHQLKFGFSWALYKKVQNAFANTQGGFKFDGSFTKPVDCVKGDTQTCGSDYADFLLGDAQQYQEDAYKINGKWNNLSLATYIQDNWRVNKRLTLNLGLRWDGIPHTYEASHQSTNFYPGLYSAANVATFNDNGTICKSAADPGCTAASNGLSSSSNPILANVLFYTNGIGTGGLNGIPKGLVNDKWANFGPRIGFAYDLTGQGKTVFRGGFGVMYERIQGNDMYNGATNPPGDLQPTLNGVSLSNPGLNVTSGTVITSADLPVLPLGVTGIDKNYKTPTTYQYSIGIQQSLSSNSVFSASYVGSQGRHMNYYRAINLPDISLLPAMVAAGSLDNQDVLYKGFGGIRLAENGGNAHYNSLQMSLTGRVKRDLHLQVSYTFSKAVDSTTSNGSGGDLNNATNPYVGWQYDVGPSQFDRRNNFFVNFVYDIPLFRNNSSHLVKGTLGGWQLSGIITAQSGAPINLGVNGTTAASIINNSGTRPDVNGAISYPKKVSGWFDTSVFSAPACQTGPDCYGNLGFDAIRGPGRQNWDMTLTKTFAFTERFKTQFRVDVYNAWNHTEFKGDANNGGIGTNLGASNFGQVTQAYDGRELQLGLKLIF
jgi:Carboxypeptidase regulatory-like domain